MNLFGLRIMRVEGASMEPLVPADSFAVFRPTRRAKPGDVVLVDHPRFGRIVKSIRDVDADGISLSGQSKFSVSTARLGKVRPDRVIGKMIHLIPPDLAKS